MLGKIVEVVIGAILIGALGVTAVTSLATPANTTGWTAPELAVWAVLGIVVVIAFLLILLKPAMSD